ncbi:MAG: hypothetical protein EOO91_01940 [Pedobacter sp.]|nr:MAG: hypothetical protein EOO91_01940 [Pedobacter sp.]
MDTLKDFFSDLKDRISNPFISSFVIAWLICNYQIFIALFFYKLAELSTDGSVTYFTIIEKARNNDLNFWLLPLIVALFYTFVMPFVKSGVKIYQAWILAGTDKRIYKVTDTSVVSIENHKKVSKDLRETQAQYAELIENESTFKNDIEGLHIRIKEMQDKHTETLLATQRENEKRQESLREEYDGSIHQLQSKYNEDLKNRNEEFGKLQIESQQNYSALQSITSIRNELQHTIDKLEQENQSLLKARTDLTDLNRELYAQDNSQRSRIEKCENILNHLMLNINDIEKLIKSLHELPSSDETRYPHVIDMISNKLRNMRRDLSDFV